ncbi:hypothetical protein [Sphingomonas sp.]|uniref:hypothetical protein n=1 Tax=Sphingomonas sp. TaxID=28214 RepID=UPI0017B62EC4|nr:hypothetical protein [Sphingomonas sp.]MBA3510454.1 hypothetical protein [Sphingomonas sp.]
MLSFDTAAAVAAAPSTASIDPTLKRLLADRVHDWTATGLLDLTHLLVVEAGDTEESIVEAAGFSPLTNTLDGRRFGSAGFEPQFEWLSDVGGHYELIQTVGNDGFAFHIFIPDREGVDPELLALCRNYSDTGGGQ